MTAVLGTLPFLATLWLLVVVGAAVLEESGVKIAAALKGKPKKLPPMVSSARRGRAGIAVRTPRRAREPFRVAA